MTNKIDKCVYIGNFYTLEVMGRGSDTQLQVCKNVSSIIKHGIRRCKADN